MSAKGLLQKILLKSLLHKGKLFAIVEAVYALIDGNQLTLAQLGRHMPNHNVVKSNINKINRLIGNAQFNAERELIYTQINAKLLQGISRPIIVVDWSDTHPGADQQLLCATLCLSGRGIVCYEKLFTDHLYNSRKAHQQFLRGLARVLPSHCRPIIVTDAASSFGVHWFRFVERYSWQWVGRVRKGHTEFCIDQVWHSIKPLYEKATSTRMQITHALLTKMHRHPCTITVYKKIKHRKRQSSGYATRRSHRHTTAKHQRQGHEPWVLVSSPDLRLSKTQITAIYHARMTIEERFRDTKDPLYGSGFLYSRSKGLCRLENLLMIDVLAKFVLWCVGTLAEANNMARDFQSNTIRHRRVLSIVRLGREVMKRQWRTKIPINLNTMKQTISRIQKMILCV